MSSVLHPVGPEAPQTYWVRRAVVLGAAILALIVVIALIVSQNSNGSVVATPTPTPTAVVSSGPPPYTPTPTPAPSPSSTSSASSKASATAKAETETETETDESESDSRASARPSESASAGARPKSDGPVACAGDRLRPTITGERKLEREQDNTFSISLINGSGQTCTVKVSGDNFELKIYSGTDRIWSSKDCSTAVKSVTKKLAEEQSVSWKMTWKGNRSKDDCKKRPEIPEAGTYFATAQYEGAKPVQLRMILRG